jgi:tRNA threonylcarbamoyladenosine modification (KEOPS) complex Cgi121 subunit
MTYEIAGARGTVDDPEGVLKKTHTWSEANGGDVLLADARIVLGRDHLETAVRHALRAQSNGTMAARSVAAEALRYLSAQRQVADAIRIAGIHRGTKELAIAVFGRSGIQELLATFGWSRDDRVLDSEGKSFVAIGITEAEWATLPPNQRADLALEKVALLDTER